MRTIGMHLASVAASALFAAEAGSGSGGGKSKPVADQSAAEGVTVENGGEAATTYPRAGGDPSIAATGETATGDNGAAPATSFSPSGAPNQVVADVDPSHPAVDNDPRANTTADQNRIDFNDPYMSGAEASARNLADQAKD